MGSNIVYYDLMVPVIKKYYRKNNEEQSIISILERTLYCQQTYFAKKFIKKISNELYVCKFLPEYGSNICKFSQGYVITEERIYHRCTYKDWFERYGAKWKED